MNRNASNRGDGVIVEASGVIKGFTLGKREIQVLRGIDLAVHAGEFVAVVGPSGAGKSTLLHILGLLEQPSEGTVSIEGNVVSNLSIDTRALIRRSRIGFVFQFHHLLPGFSALENVMIPSLILGKSHGEAEPPARELLEKLGLGERLQNKPAELSGGEQQRVAVARALVNNPSVILADEPTGNLDRGTGRKLEDDLVQFAKDHQAAVLVVTHNEEWAKRADRLVSIIDGRIENGSVGVQ